MLAHREARAVHRDALAVDEVVVAALRCAARVPQSVSATRAIVADVVDQSGEHGTLVERVGGHDVVAEPSPLDDADAASSDASKPGGAKANALRRAVAEHER